MFSIIETSYDPDGYGASIIGISRESAPNRVSLLQMWKPGKKISARAQRKVSGFLLESFVFTATK